MKPFADSGGVLENTASDAGCDEVGGVTAGRDEDIAGMSPGAAPIALTPGEHAAGLRQVGGLTAESRGNRDRTGLRGFAWVRVTAGAGNRAISRMCVMVAPRAAVGRCWGAAALARARFVLLLQ